MVGCAFFARIFDVTLLSHGMISLGLTVWIIYTVDHLVDARKSKGTPATERHRFHQRHSISLAAALIIAGALLALEALFIRKPVLYAGLAVAVMVVIYLLLQASLRFLKEIAGAVLYASGVVAAPWSLMERALSATEWGIVTLFALTALINLLLFSLFDRKTDLSDNHYSFATTFGVTATRSLIAFLLLTIVALAIALMVKSPDYQRDMITLLLMNSVLLTILIFPGYFALNDRFRRVGDSVFLIPLVYLLMH